MKENIALMVRTIKPVTFISRFFASYSPPISFSFCWNLKHNIKSEIFWNKWVYVLATYSGVKKSSGETEREYALVLSSNGTVFTVLYVTLAHGLSCALDICFRSWL